MIVEPHPLLDLRAFATTFPRPLGEMLTPPEILSLLSLSAQAPFKSDDTVREAVRAMLRQGGFKPAGRSKPASEYLIRAVTDGALASINAAVDVCNIVSLHSGLPISVVDLAKAKPPFRAAIAPAGSAYVFNASGQMIDLQGLLCLVDAAGPCGNAVKDAQRTKTDAATTQTLTVIWGATALSDRTARAEAWYRELLHRLVREYDGCTSKFTMIGGYMATAEVTDRLLTAREFLLLPDDGVPKELVRGRIVTMNVPAPRHGHFCALIVEFFATFARRHDLGRLISNNSGVITEHDPDTVRAPDVSFYSYKRVPKGPLPEEYFDVMPELIFELRPSVNWSETFTKVKEFLKAGVSTVCVLDPQAELITVTDNDGPPKILEKDKTLTLPSVFPGFELPIARLFE